MVDDNPIRTYYILIRFVAFFLLEFNLAYQCMKNKYVVFTFISPQLIMVFKILNERIKTKF